MPDEPDDIEHLVARRIREQLDNGGIEALLEALKALSPTPRSASGGQMAATLPAVRASFGGSGSLSATVAAIGTGVVGTQAVKVIEPASPALAEDIRKSDSEKATLLLTAFMALMQVLQVLMEAYQFFHHEPPTQSQIVQIFNQTTVMLTNSPMPPHG